MTTENGRADALTADAVMKEARERVYRDSDDDATGNVIWFAEWICDRLAAAPSGYCERAGGCVCGGDLPRVREGCSEWVKSKPAPSPADERAVHALDCQYILDDNPWAICTCGKGSPNNPRAASASQPVDERAAFGAEWMLVKRERIDEIKRYAYSKFEESYQGRGLYDEDAVRRNANLGEEMLTNIQSELEWIDEDTKDFEAERAASANETGAEGAKDDALIKRLCVLRGKLRHDVGAWEVVRDAIAALRRPPARADARVGLTDGRIARLRAAIEGECDGLHVDYHHAKAILAYLDDDRA